ncbi:OV-16 antigen [Caerostris extrusa]|uniref:OV-16 antigen n=1 Tax=Caerostris extrusa TaxID=172846 RepID=A0AAV4XUQ5_CAEEX|nr:OV-16 antigen [Caerostris extrusa]
MSTIEYKDRPVTCGNQLDLKTTRNPPTVVDYEADETKYYTLIMFDPDAPYPQNSTLRSYRHWLIENIEGNFVNNGDVVTSYLRPTPPADSDSHRYIFLIYEQHDSMKLNDNFDNDTRGNFDVPKFAQERNLIGPVAGNFFFLHP